MSSNNLQKIFLTGMFRSGTTLLARALGAHPQISFASDPYFEFFKYARNQYYQEKIKDFDPESPLSDKFLEDNELNQGFIRDFFQIKFNKNDLVQIQQRISKAAKDYSPKIIPLLTQIKGGSNITAVDLLEQLSDLIPQAYPTSDLNFIGFKEVWLEEFMSPLLDSGFRVVQIIRDPRAVAASNKKSSTGRYPILFLIRQWRKSVMFSLLDKNRPDYHLVRFEDLIIEPEVEFKKLCQSIAVPFSKNLVDFAKFKDGGGRPWVQNSSFKGERKFNPAAVNNWQKVLTEEEIRLIELLCAPELFYLHYQPLYQDFSVSTLTDFRDSKTGLAEWIKRYDYWLNEERKEEELMRLFAWQHPELKWEDQLLDKLFVSKKVYEELSL